MGPPRTPPPPRGTAAAATLARWLAEEATVMHQQFHDAQSKRLHDQVQSDHEREAHYADEQRNYQAHLVDEERKLQQRKQKALDLQAFRERQAKHRREVNAALKQDDERMNTAIMDRLKQEDEELMAYTKELQQFHEESK